MALPTAWLKWEMEVVRRSEVVPRIVTFYERYLQDQDVATFIRSTSQFYTTGTLARLATAHHRVTRRAAVMAVALVGGYESNGVLARALHDPDRGVRMIADATIHEVWKRYGTEDDQRRLSTIQRFVDAGLYATAVALATVAIGANPTYAEAWYWRAVAQFRLGRFVACREDCRRALELNVYHFGAANIMGHCYLKLGDPISALASFRKGLSLNPNQEALRFQVRKLERALEGRG